MILIAGATGFLGGEICRRLVENGESVRGLVRRTSDPAGVSRLRTLGAETAVGDLRDRESLDAACRGVRTVVSTVTSTRSRQPGDSIEAGEMKVAPDLAASSAWLALKQSVTFTMVPA